MLSLAVGVMRNCDLIWSAVMMDWYCFRGVGEYEPSILRLVFDKCKWIIVRM